MLDRSGLFSQQYPSARWSWADEGAQRVRRYRRGELEKKFCRNGFNVLFSSTFNTMLMPLVAFSRLSFRRTPLYVDPREQASLWRSGRARDARCLVLNGRRPFELSPRFVRCFGRQGSNES